ncbi:NAD-dependent epimerase/dehydratase family protein [Moraxella osloensis]|uniref:NAD-dependent epimerase/dehydratase family protein n=1 Tax=Faucicola osloensis TaxID=34062 RepID=A0AAW6T8Q4_FAUOS|nr:NAD-dependent epimerase/dehydratase family protein [Moraxella osloensis]MDI4509029.1 NAD-dependent epimerase/dehydratase family protein [Moraxella osloensis]
MMKILVTGATGFVGRYFVNDLSKTDEVIACVRKKSSFLPSSVQQIVSNNFFDIAIPKDTDVIVHLAGIAHNKNNSVDEFKKINVDGTLELARKALEANIKRFIFISSIGVNGNSTHGKAFTEQDIPNPTNDYTKSKYEAEKALAKLFENTNIDLVIIRPPLIYAHDAPGNFSKLLMLIKLGQFLPFGCTHNQRSFIAIENLVSFITACIYHDTKINETFLIADDEVISTKQLIQCLSSGMGKSMILLPVPTKLLSTLADVTGKVGMFEQLYGNLQIDNRKAKKFFNWHPPKHSLNALKEVGNLYRNNKK